MRVLVTGGGGYIGSCLVAMLLERGHHVTVLDRFFFGDTVAPHKNLSLVHGDIRNCPASVLGGIEAVCDLAALSNDPLGELLPEKTYAINHLGRARVCALAKAVGAKRYLLASSCSVYGFRDGIADETSEPNPLSVYARASLLAERSTFALADHHFSVTALRQATVYGASRRMRFDTAINMMTLALWRNGIIRVGRTGEQWRPYIHMKDTCRAFCLILESERSAVSGEVFNVGSDEQNAQVLPRAQMAAEAVGVPFKMEWFGEPDTRSYRVGFKKIASLGFRTRLTFEDGAREVYAGLVARTLRDSPRTRTVEWYKRLLARDPLCL